MIIKYSEQDCIPLLELPYWLFNNQLSVSVNSFIKQFEDTLFNIPQNKIKMKINRNIENYYPQPATDIFINTNQIKLL